MNQEQNNMNPNNFNTQSNNGIPNNQPLNNQSFNNTFNQNVVSNINFNQSTVQPQTTPSYEQPVNQMKAVQPELQAQPITQMNIEQPVPQPMNNMFESSNTNNQSFNNKPPKKMNLRLIIGIIIVSLIVIFLAIIGVKFVIKNNNVIDDTVNSTDNELNYYPWVVNQYEIKYKLDENDNFLMMVDGSIYVSSDNKIVDYLATDKKYMVVGKIINGSINIGDKVELLGYPYDTNEKIVTKSVKDIKIVSKAKFDEDYYTENKVLENTNTAKSGDTIALILDNVTRDDINRGQVLAKPNYIRLHKKIKADMYYYEINQEEFNDKMEYQCYFRNSDYSCNVTLLDNEKLFPGQNSSINIDLKNTSTAVLVGDEFQIRKGGRSIAKATVSEILE